MTFNADKVTDLQIFVDPEETDEFLFNAVSIQGLFSKKFMAVGDGVPVEDSTPQARFNDTDIVGIEHDDVLTHVSSGVPYNVTGVHKDGAGRSLILLSVD